MSRQCKTCKYWDSQDMRYGSCMKAESDYTQMAVASPTKALAVSEYCYRGFLETTADFGCVMWEEKEVEG